MSHQLERTSPCRVKITANLGPEQATERREHVTALYLRRAHIDGFRRGKAPRPLVERRFAKEIAEDVQEELMNLAWREVREGGALRPAGPLEVREAAFQPDGSFEIQGELDVYPEVTIGSIDSFKAPEFDVEPSGEEVEAQLGELRERQASWEPVEGEQVGEGLLVEAEVFGEFPDGGGEPFHEERSLFRIGGGEVHPEIEAATLGHRVGDEVRTEKLLGPEAGAERDGKRIAYRLVIKALRHKRLPQIDDAFASSLGVSGGVAALKEQIRLRVRGSKMRQRRDAWRGALIRHLAGEQAIELPERVVQEETREEMVRFVRALAESGVNVERAEFDWTKLEADVRTRVEGRLRGELVLDTTAETLGIAVADDEIDREVERQARGLGLPFAELKGNLAKKDGLEKIRAILRREKVVEEALRRAGVMEAGTVKATPAGEG